MSFKNFYQEQINKTKTRSSPIWSEQYIKALTDDQQKIIGTIEKRMKRKKITKKL